MKAKLIMLPQPIIVNGKIDVESLPNLPTGVKVIAGTPELPSIDFSALSEEDCRKIECVYCGKLAKKILGKDRLDDYDGYYFIEGFKAAQSLNEKKFSEEDLLDAWELGAKEGLPLTRRKKENLLKFLSQPKVFDVEVEMEWYKDFPTGEGFGGAGSIDFERLKITNNSIRIIKVL